ncbi:hypothetical protein Tco_1370792 [Tanacetum coccineum]
MDPSHSSVLSSVSQNSHVVSLNALTEEIVAYEKESDDTHAVKNLDALCTPESFVTHSNFDTPGGTVYYIPKVSAAKQEVEHSFFSHFTNSGSTLMNFMNCFETAMEKQRHVQERLDHKTIDTVLKLKTLLKIERHASNDLRCIIKESPYVYEMPNKKKKKPQSVDKGNDKADENDKVDMFFKKDGLYKVLRSVEYYEKIVLKFDIIFDERSELVRTLRNGVKKFEDDQMMIDFCKQYRELFNDNEFKLYEYSKDDDSEGETDGDNEDNNHDDDGAPTADANKKKESENQTKERNKEEIDKQTEARNLQRYKVRILKQIYPAKRSLTSISTPKKEWETIS